MIKTSYLLVHQSEDELEKLIEDVKNNPPSEDSPPIPDLVNGKDDTASGGKILALVFIHLYFQQLFNDIHCASFKL